MTEPAPPEYSLAAQRPLARCSPCSTFGWVPVVYWGGAGTVALTLAGGAAIVAADWWNQRVRRRYQAWVAARRRGTRTLQGGQSD